MPVLGVSVMIIKVRDRLFEFPLERFRVRGSFRQQAAHQDTVGIGIDPLGEVEGGIQVFAHGEQSMPGGDHRRGVLADGFIPALEGFDDRFGKFF